MIDWLKSGATDPDIELNGCRVPIAVRRHSRAKRLTLRLAPDGQEVRITLPRWARSAEAIAFAHARADWLAAQHARIPKREAPRPGGTINYRGTARRIEWDAAYPRTPTLAEGAVRLGGSCESIEPRLRRWLEGQIMPLLTADIDDYADAANLPRVPVAISRALKRWGSCSQGGRIRINWRLIQAPDFVRRSVVAHEIAHLVHFDHSPQFHALLQSIYEDDIAIADRWLKEQGRSLYATFG